MRGPVPRVLTEYDEPLDQGISFVGEKSLTSQSEADSADVNLIVSRFQKTGLLPGFGDPGQFLDVSQVPDYRGALEQVKLADAAFMQLDAKVRARFDNDPAQFLDFVSDPANGPEMVTLGLATAPQVEQKVVVAAAAAQAAAGQ